MRSRSPLWLPARALWIPLLLLAASLGLPALVALGHANASPVYPPLTGSISGPGSVGTAQKALYVVHATGGPAISPSNGTQTGILAYRASLVASNTSGALISPSSGVLVNQTVSLSFLAPNLTEVLELNVVITSSISGTNSTNQSEPLHYTIHVVRPYHLQATLFVTSTGSVGAFAVTVTLDGNPVGSVSVPTLSGGSSYPLSFYYVAVGLSPGTHVFGINLAQQHGLVTFAGGTTSFSSTFYVAGPAPDNTIWFLAGASAFLGAILILTTRVGARRRGGAKK